MSYVQYSPQKIFENDKDGVIPVLTIAGTYGVASNQSLVTGVSNKRVRVVGYAAQSGTATQGVYGFINGSGGSALSSFVAPPLTLAPALFPITEHGYFETSTGTGLFLNIATASVSLNIFYIIYTP